MNIFNDLQEKKFVFAGNRAFVYEAMIELNLNVVKTFAIPNSYFSKYLESNHVKFELIEDKNLFIQKLKNMDFDYFISNGLPVILPISELTKENNKRFINIHPSYLPDLRGADPVPGALLFGRDSGATCHYMNDNIDSGKIISQIKIDNSLDLDAGLLYQLSFIAEKDAFKLAYEKVFKGEKEQVLSGNEIYYSFKENDLKIDFSNKNNQIIGQIKAFSTVSKGAYFKFKGEIFQVFDAEYINNEYFNSIKDRYNNLEIIFRYENCIVFKKDNELIKFKQIKGNNNKINKGDYLNEMD